MFRSVTAGILLDAKDTADNSYSMPIVPTEIELNERISKDYFHWWKALAVLCVTPDMHRCNSLIKSGVFDGAIKMARDTNMRVTRGGVVDLDTALDFCQRLLIKNGLCEKSLPGTFFLYRS